MSHPIPETLSNDLKTELQAIDNDIKDLKGIIDKYRTANNNVHAKAVEMHAAFVVAARQGVSLDLKQKRVQDLFHKIHEFDSEMALTGDSRGKEISHRFKLHAEKFFKEASKDNLDEQGIAIIQHLAESLDKYFPRT